MATDVDMANMALGLLDEAPITGLSQDVKAARLCNLHYVQTRRAELSKHDWAFAISTSSITGTDGGGVGLNWSYPLDASTLRVLPLTYDGEYDGVPIAWRQEGMVVRSDQESPRRISVIVDKPTPDDWHPLFVDVFTAALAVKIAHPLTHKAGMIDIAKSAYQTALDEALKANAMRTRGSLYLGSWASQRGDNRFWRA